jgi:prepilin-type processing-associated H-X9-DG protein
MFFFFVPITAAVLFPVFAQAREQARSTACASNLRQVGFAMSMYAQDYDQRAPRKESWCDDVLPYVRDTRGMPRRVFQCPSLAGQSGAQAYNALLSAAPLAHLPSPSSLVEEFDARGGWNLSGGAQLADPRHRQGLNTLFVDGHVQWMRSLDRVAWKPGAPPAPETGRHHTRHRGRRHRHSGG